MTKIFFFFFLFSSRNILSYLLHSELQSTRNWFWFTGWDSTLFSHIVIQLTQHHSLEKLFFPLLLCSTKFVKNQEPCLCRSVSGLSILFHWPTYLLTHHYHSLITIIVYLIVQFPPSLFSFLMSVLLFLIFWISIKILESACKYPPKKMYGWNYSEIYR